MLEYEKMTKEKLYEGPIVMTRKGLGFFTVPGQDEDLIVPNEWTNHALSGDIVKVVPAGAYRDPTGRMPPRPAGKVAAILRGAPSVYGVTLVAGAP